MNKNHTSVATIYFVGFAIAACVIVVLLLTKPSPGGSASRDAQAVTGLGSVVRGITKPNR